jgi:hypothetical protein
MNCSALFTYPLEIRLNTLDDFVCLVFAIFLGKPLKWIMISFARVAGETCWHDIGRNCSGASLTQWNKMLSAYSHRVKQSRWIAAISATVIPIFEAPYPIITAKTIGQYSFACPIPMTSSTRYFRTFSHVFFVRGLYSILVFGVVFLVPFAYTYPTAWMQSTGAICFFAEEFFSRWLYLFAFSAAPHSLWDYIFGFRNVTAPYRITGLAVIRHIGTAFAEIFRCHWEYLQTAFTLFSCLRWIVSILHSASLPLYHKLLSAGGVIFHFLGATLSDTISIPQGAV